MVFETEVDGTPELICRIVFRFVARCGKLVATHSFRPPIRSGQTFVPQCYTRSMSSQSNVWKLNSTHRHRRSAARRPGLRPLLCFKFAGSWLVILRADVDESKA